MIIQRNFPNFQFIECESDFKYWEGEILATRTNDVYSVKVIYNPYKPKVFIMKPLILKNAPHRFHDGSLCLYYPQDGSYNEEKLIGETIIPWTCEWIYYYETWLEEGVWWGPEAPHDIKSRKGQKLAYKKQWGKSIG